MKYNSSSYGSSVYGNFSRLNSKKSKKLTKCTTTKKNGSRNEKAMNANDDEVKLKFTQYLLSQLLNLIIKNNFLFDNN